MKLQVFGQSGMLGGAVVKAALRRGHLVDSNQSDLEIVMPGHIHAPIVINCAGLVKQRQYKPSRFMVVNAVGPHRLAEACDAAGARLIHVSTDCVFSQPGPHCECSAPDADDYYARSKLAGEVIRTPHLTVRTSFVGFGSRGLIADLLNGQTVRASNRLLWSGHTVDTVADALISLAEMDVSGLLHIPGEFQTRWALCNTLKRYLGAGLIMRDDEFRADRRLMSDRWPLGELPSFAAQLEQMERP